MTTTTYSTNARFTKQATNANPNTWGKVLNAVLDLIDEAVFGVADIDVTGTSNVTLTTQNGATDQARHAVLELTGTLGADIELLVPSVEKVYTVRGAWTGANNTVTMKISGSGTSVVLETGETALVYTNGTDIYRVDSSAIALLISNNLSDLDDVPTARTNLGLGDLATQDTIGSDDLESGVTQSLTPTGSVLDYAGTSAPSGWLLCYGQEVSRTTYSDLFSVLGVTYGNGDGTTTFNLPDLRGRVVAGKDNMGGTSANRLTDQSGGLDGDTLGDTGGSETHTLTESEMPEHDHFIMNSDGPTNAPAVNDTTHLVRSNETFGNATYSLRGTDTEPNIGPSELVGGSEAHNNVQPTIILNKIIKT